MGVLLVEGKAGLELEDGLVEVGLLEEGDAVVFAKGRGVGAEGEGLGVERDGGFGVAGLD